MPALCHQQPGANAVLKRRPVVQRGGKHRQRIKPAAGLVNCFHDEICRKMLVKPFLVFKWVVDLRIRHGTAFKPAVEHVADPAHHRLARWIVRIRINDIVNVRLVQIGYVSAGLFLNLGNGTKDVNPRKFRIIGFPNRNRRSPETVAGDRPIACPLQPFAEASVFDMPRNPVDFLIVLNHVVAEVRYLDEPGRHRLVNQRRVRAPAERVGMLILFFFNQQPVGFQPQHNRLVGIKDLLPFIVGNFCSEFSRLVNRANHREILVIRAASLKVVLPETRCNVNHAGTVFGRNKLAGQYSKSAFVF